MWSYGKRRGHTLILISKKEFDELLWKIMATYNNDDRIYVRDLFRTCIRLGLIGVER